MSSRDGARAWLIELTPDMTEQDRPTLNPKELHRIKDELVRLWEQLPPQHQATMALVLIDQVMQGEWGAWLQEAIAIKWSEDAGRADLPMEF